MSHGAAGLQKSVAFMRQILEGESPPGPPPGKPLRAYVGAGASGFRPTFVLAIRMNSKEPTVWGPRSGIIFFLIFS